MKQLTFALLLPILAGLITACTPKEPVNNVEERGHELPWSQVITFTPCTASDTSALFANGIQPTGQPAVQFTVQTDEATGKLIKSEPVSLKRGTWYHMTIDLYNKQKVSINDQYLTPEQAPCISSFSPAQGSSRPPIPTPHA